MMRVSLTGVLKNCRSAMGKNDTCGYGFMLQELEKHLRELRDRYRSGDTQVVDEFFDLYVLDEETERAT